MWNETSFDVCIREFQEELGRKANTNKTELVGTIKRVKDFIDIWHIVVLV